MCGGEGERRQRFQQKERIVYETQISATGRAASYRRISNRITRNDRSRAGSFAQWRRQKEAKSPNLTSPRRAQPEQATT
jgi:hypothetical protein